MVPLFAVEIIDNVASDSLRKLIVWVIVTAITTTLSFLVGRYLGRARAKREWQSKLFLNRVIVSLNLFVDNTLKIRTVMERGIEDVFLNSIAVEKVLEAAKSCTVEKPVMLLPKADRWYVLNFVLNAVAEQFAAGQVKQDAGAAVHRVKYAVFLTCEVLGEERIRKVRAMLIRAEHLEAFPYPSDLPQFEQPWHEDRIKTLRSAAQLYQTERDHFMLLEVCV